MTPKRISCSFRTVSFIPPPLVVAGASGELMGLWLFQLGRSVLSQQLVLLGLQNGLDAFQAGGRSVREGFLTGVLQTLRGIAIRQLQQGHTGLVALLLHLVGGEKESYHGSSMLTNLFRPADKPLAVLLQVGLVVRRHMALQRAVLVGAAVEPQMGSDTGSGEEDFYCGPGKTHIHLLLDVLIRHGIIHAFYADVVVILDSSHLPDCQLKRCSRKRQQEQFLLRKASYQVALSFLEGLVVEGFQLLTDCLIQFREGQKLAIAQRRQNPGGDHTHRALHKGLVLGVAGAGRKDGGAAVL